MTEKKVSFEAQLSELEKIVTNLENGSIPLEEALEQFKNGVKLSQDLEKKLNDADATVAKLMDQDGQIKPLDISETNDAN